MMTDAGAERSSRADKDWDRRLGHQRQEIRIAGLGSVAAEQLARMGLVPAHCWEQHFQKAAHHPVGIQKGRWGQRRTGLFPLRSRSQVAQQVVRMNLAGLAAEPAVAQMRPGAAVVPVKMDLGPAGLAVEQLEGLARFAGSLRSDRKHRRRLVEVAVQMG